MARNPSELDITNQAEHLSPLVNANQGDLRKNQSAIRYDVLVLDAHLRQSVVTVRSLGRKGKRVAALDTAVDVPAFSSRWCLGHFTCSESEGSEEYLRYLEGVLDQIGVSVLIPSSDATVALFRLHRERLEKRVRIAQAKDPALGIAINKEQTLEIAKRLGLHIPTGVVVSSASDVPEALKEIGLPAVIKPVESWHWGKNESARIVSQLVTTPDEAKKAVEFLTRMGGTVLFQKFLSGRREAVSFMYANGQVYARFGQWAKRTEPPLGGTSVLRQSIAIPADIGDPSERLIREIDLEGYSEVEFRRDSQGVPYLMEINPRLSASVEMAVRSGVDFPYLIYQWASGEKIDKVTGYRTGGWMRYLGGDIMTTIEAIHQRGRPGVTPPVQAILGFCLSFFRPMGYDYFDWKDMRPAMKATTHFTVSWIRGAIRKRVPWRKGT